MMASIAATVRHVKNKETNVDMYVPSFIELPGSLLTPTSYEYHVVVVSSLPVFKTKAHSFKDTVQFVVKKRYSDFESLRTHLDARYSTTILPFLPKRLILADDKTNASERLAACDQLVRAIARDPKLCVCSIVLSFLGITLMGSSGTSSVNEAPLDMEDVMLPTTDPDLSAQASQRSLPLETILDGDVEDANLFSLDADEEEGDLSNNVNNNGDGLPAGGLAEGGSSHRSAGLHMFARLNLEEPAPIADVPQSKGDHSRPSLYNDDDEASDLLRVGEIDDFLSLVAKKTQVLPHLPSRATEPVSVHSKSTAAVEALASGTGNDRSTAVPGSMASSDILKYIAENDNFQEDNDDLFN